MTAEPGSRSLRARLRRTVLLVAGLNLACFSVEVTVAVAIGSVSLFADSVDFLEDTAINLLIAVALAWSPHRQALAGKAMALVILAPPWPRRGRPSPSSVIPSHRTLRPWCSPPAARPP